MREIKFSDAINEVLRESLKKDKRIFLFGEDIGLYGGAFGVTKGLLDEFGCERVIDTPISENSIIGVAGGAAMLGMRPIVEIMFMDFITLAMDQIVNHISKFKFMYGGQVELPIVIRTACGAGKSYGPTHSQSFDSWFLSCPGIKVVSPSNAYDAMGLLRSSLKEKEPVIFIEHKMLYNKKFKIPEKEFTVPLGKAKILKEGKDITLITYSNMVELALNFSGNYNDVEIEVIDLRTLKPLDLGLICESVKKTSRAVILEEGNLSGGVGSELAGILQKECFGYLSAPVARVASPDTPIPFSPHLEKRYLPGKEELIEAVEEILKY